MSVVQSTQDILRALSTLQPLFQDFENVSRTEEPDIFQEGCYKKNHSYQKAMHKQYEADYQVIQTRGDSNCFYYAISQTSFEHPDYAHILWLAMAHKMFKHETRLQEIPGQFTWDFD